MMVAAPATAEDLPDAQLVALVRQGQGHAYASIMRRNNRRLFRLVRAMLGDDAEAEEVVQETYVRAYAALAEWRQEASLSTWLSRIALNEALGRIRRRKRMVNFETAVEESMAGGRDAGPFDHLLHPSPEAVAARGEIRFLLEKAVDDLPPDFRAVFVLRAVEQLSVEETAAVLGLRSETVRTRFFRARRMLRQALGEQLAAVLEDSFPFAGARCDRLIDRVLQRLGISAKVP